MITPRAWWWVWYWSHEDYAGDPELQREFDWWTCNESTRAGDFALLYVKRPTSALVGLLQAQSDAEKNSGARVFSSHPWACQSSVVCKFAKPLTLATLRKDRRLAKKWGLIRANFQAAHGAPPRIDEEILKLLLRHLPQIEKYAD
jgi:predicted transcriptional regulator